MSAALHATLAGHLEQIADLYQVRPRITLIVRVPGKPDQGVFLSDDNWTEAATQVACLQKSAAYVAGPPEPAPSADAAPSLDALALEADGFARTTFPARSAESISEHLRREAVELAATPNDPEEMADVFILLGNLVHFTGTDLNAAVVAKLAKNRARKWGKPDAHGVVEHVRETPPADAATEAVRDIISNLKERREMVNPAWVARVLEIALSSPAPAPSEPAKEARP